MTTTAALADCPAGPALGAALADLEVSLLTGSDLVDVLCAQSRQQAHQAACYLRAMVGVGCSSGAGVAEWASSEIGAALTLSGRTADRELQVAEMVVVHLPPVYAAMYAGRLTLAKATAFADLLADVTAEQRAVLCADLVPRAEGWTVGQLRARLERAIIDIDPEWAQRRYRYAVRERRVVGYLAADGTVTLTATSLPAPDATAAAARLDKLAARIHRAGHPSPVGQLRADLLLGLIGAALHNLTVEEIVARFLADTTHGGEQPAGGTTDVDTRVGAPGSGQGFGFAPTGVEVRIGLATLLGLRERAGELPGWGAVLPSVARSLVRAQQRGAQWRYVVTDPEGRLIFGGTTRRRPRFSFGSPGVCDGGIVELQVSAQLLEQLVADPAAHGDWSSVIADIAAQYADRHRAMARLNAHPGDRFARSALACYLQLRDRTCLGVACGRIASRAQLDHTRDHAAGGSTTDNNLGCLCARHHGYKTKGWWQLTQPTPGHFRWRSPLGRIYRARGEPVAPPTVEPRPRDPEPDPGIALYDTGPILPTPSRPWSPTSAPDTGDPNEPPPF